MKFKMLFLWVSILFLATSCKKDLVDTSTNALEDINDLTVFESKISNGVSLMFFHATWCSICKAQRPAVNSVLENTKFSNIFFGEVNYETNKAIVEKFKVLGFPTILIFKDKELKFTLDGGGNSQKSIEDLLLKLK
jgi:thiol-disulfide isomerase/thioredoxin